MKEKIILINLLLLTFCLKAISQYKKPAIDERAVNEWFKIDDNYSDLSDGANYTAYRIEKNHKLDLVIQSNISLQKAIIPGFANAMHENTGFIGEHCFVYLSKDSLKSIDLSTWVTRFIGSASKFFKLKKNGKYDLCYLEVLSPKLSQLVFVNIKSGKKHFLDEVEDMNYTALDGDHILYFKKVHGEKIGYVFDINTLKSVRATEEKKLVIQKQNEVSSIWFEGNKVFEDSDLQRKSNICLRSAEFDKATGNIKLVLAAVQKKSKPEVINAEFHIWSYNSTIQPDNPVNKEILFNGILFTNNHKLLLLDDEEVKAEKIDQEHWLVGKRTNFLREPATQYFSLISSMNGKVISLDRLDSLDVKDKFVLSPDKHFLIYNNRDRGDYYSYDLNTGKTVNLTGMTGFFKERNQRAGLSFPPEQLPGSYNASRIIKVLKDGCLLTRDKFDFWKIDPSGKSSPICLTNGYGRKNNIILNIIDGFTFESSNQWKGKMIVSAFNPATKANGFFAISLDRKGDPEEIIFSSKIAFYSKGANIAPQFKKIIKAKDRNALLILGTAQTKSENWYLIDERKLKIITQVFPEENFNWMHSELISWKTKRGLAVQGVLYKPEDFDSNRKYPVIISYYEEKTDDLNLFHQPALMKSGEINIPWMVSRGYLVFTPDMKYRTGEAGQSALECLESGVDELCTRSYIDSLRIGLSGHSWGGFETAYFVTHSSRYVAALIGAPAFIDRISNYNHLNMNKNLQNESEWGQGGMAGTPWEKTYGYIAESPIYSADKVTSPILIVHNNEDMSVLPVQGITFFRALKRLGKPSWLLDYQKEGHLVDNEDNKLDLTIRATQFFDHYLMGKPAPLWMIDPEKKSGYELDTLGRTPKRSLLISKEEYKKIDEYSKIPLEEKLKPSFTKLKDNEKL